VTPSRRDFLKHVGIAVASLAMARCMCLGRSIDDPTDPPDDDSPRGQLRRCWLGFGWLKEQSQDWDNGDNGEEARAELARAHQTALDELIAAGELDPEVADCVHQAYEAATYHVWRANCGMTCYLPAPGPDYTPTTSSQLVQQADLLAKLAEEGDLDPETIGESQAAVERDFAFLCLSHEETQALYDALVEAAGDSYNWPTFDELEFDVSPEAEQAARFLVELILEEDE